MTTGKKYLVAGGSGLVGSNLTKRLLDMNLSVESADISLPSSPISDVYKTCDLTVFDDCVNITRGKDIVFVCAAKTFGSKIMKDNPSAPILSNLKIAAGLLEASKINNVKKVIIISSSTVYQEINHPIKEEELDLNIAPYDLYLGVGWCNRYIEKLALLYYKQYGMKIGIIRPSNIYGPFDKFDDEKSNVIPSLIKKAVNKDNPYIVWGDGSVIRDFVYVEDVVDSMLAVEEKYCVCKAINVGCGKEVSIKEAVSAILKISGYHENPKFDESKPTAIPYRVLDTTKHDSILAVKSRTGFAEGIEKTVNWYRNKIK